MSDVRDFNQPMTPERRQFLRRRTKTRTVMMRENGHAPNPDTLAERMRADAQAGHNARLKREGV